MRCSSRRRASDISMRVIYIYILLATSYVHDRGMRSYLNRSIEARAVFMCLAGGESGADSITPCKLCRLDHHVRDALSGV